MTDIVLGQYVGDPKGEGDAKDGYLQDPTVPNSTVARTIADRPNISTYSADAFRLANLNPPAPV